MALVRLSAVAIVALLSASALPALAQSLTQTRWVFTQIGGERLDAQARGKTSLALDASNDRLAASAGCNRIVGGYKLDGASISFGEMAMTRMACPGDLGNRERALISALKSVVNWRIVEGNLILSDASGGVLLRLFAAGPR